MRSEGLFWEYCFIFYKVIGLVEAGYVFSALVLTSLLSLSFRRDNNQVCKNTLSCWRLSSPGIYEEIFTRGASHGYRIQTLQSAICLSKAHSAPLSEAPYRGARVEK